MKQAVVAFSAEDSLIYRSCRMDSLAWIAMKDVASCDKLGRDARDL
jgi:hypothetical protein